LESGVPGPRSEAHHCRPLHGHHHRPWHRTAQDPGDHNTAAHLGVRTATHKLIYYWKKEAYEMFDLTEDPTEQRNLLYDDGAKKEPAIAAKFAELKAEIARLQKEFKDDGQYANPAAWPKDSAYGPFDQYQPIGRKTVAEAIAASNSK